MRTIIAGGRDIDDPKVLEAALAACPWTAEITEVVSGKARGIDTLGERWAEANNIPVAPFPADWNLNGKAAGPIRNTAMSNYAEALVAIWDGQSRGTKDMIDKATAKGLCVFVWPASGGGGQGN